MCWIDDIPVFNKKRSLPRFLFVENYVFSGQGQSLWEVKTLKIYSGEKTNTFYEKPLFWQDRKSSCKGNS